MAHDVIPSNPRRFHRRLGYGIAGTIDNLTISTQPTASLEPSGASDMIFLFVLTIATGAVAAVLALGRRFSLRLAARAGMAVAMAFAGVSHLVLPTPFLQHLPTWVPMRAELIFVSGLLEIALGVALLLQQPLRRWAGLALAGYLVAVFPSNIYVAVAGVDVDGQPGGAYPWIRLPFQLLFIAWALWSTRDSDPSEPGVSARRDEVRIP